MQTIIKKNRNGLFWVPSTTTGLGTIDAGATSFLELDPDLAFSPNFNVSKGEIAKVKVNPLTVLIERTMPSLEELDELADRSSNDWLDDTSWKDVDG